MMRFDYVPNSVIAVFAHPDDAEVAAGGTLSLYSQQGSSVTIVTVTNGDKGFGDAVVRGQEQIASAEILGVDTLSLGYKDGEFDNDISFRQLLTETIRSLEPDIVICPDPSAVFFSGAYINHRDHRIAGWAVLDVVSSAVGNPKYFPGSHPASLSHVLCAGSLEPNCVIDISPTIDTKIAAVTCYSSQITQDPNIVSESIRHTAQGAGSRISCEYGEAFYHTTLDLGVDLV